ncbi:MAG TPA: polysaccharide deacetylase family protein [Alphaproteobacteria bacterium]
MRAAWTVAFAIALAAAPASAADSAVAFVYNRFDEAGAFGNIASKQLAAHIAELKSGNYTVLPLADIANALATRASLPERAVAITIDDGFRSFYTAGWPLLRAAKLPVTLFVLPDVIDRKNESYMTWDQVRELQRAGVAIGLRGPGPGTTVLRNAADAAAELAAGRARIAAELGAAPTFIAWPYGEFSTALGEAARTGGFGAGFGQHSGVIHAEENPLFLPRFVMTDSFGDVARFRIAAGAVPLKVKDVLPTDPLLAPGANPPALGFTLVDGAAPRLSCYGTGQGAAKVETLGEDRVEVRFGKPLAQGRARINCTAPSGDGRTRWWGIQLFVPRSAAAATPG